MNSVKTSDTSLLGQLIKSEPGTFARLKSGDLVEGVILKKGSNVLVVDLGVQGTGIVYRGELQNARELVRNLSAGDRIHGKVIHPDNEEGFIELSLSEANKQKAWLEVNELFEKGEILTVKVRNFNRGGLSVECNGLNAFLPISQLSNEHCPKVVDEDRASFLRAFQDLVGKELKVKIIDLNPRTNKLILSEREALEPNQKELIRDYKIGQRIDGVVSGVADFGVFVRFTDNPAVEGMIPASELSHRVVENPKEIMNVDAPVNAEIIEIKDSKILLSLKTLQEDPWMRAGDVYEEGKECKGKIYSFTPFGAIVALQGDLQGQLHITEFGSMDEMKKQLSLGKEVVCTIERVVPHEKRITLKLKK